ncbi:MAG: hypothetical protein PQJ59_13115 [Spirochaetales bacterium]|nr:hypothetical protein [Spirochaetales bacterium]
MTETIRDNKLNLLSSRAGFNQALGHFKMALGFSDDVSEGYNLADAINESLGNQEIEEHQILPILNILLVDKFAFAYRSHNIKGTPGNTVKIANTLSTWNKCHLVLATWSTDGKLNIINPADKEQWNDIPLSEGELIVLYAGPSGDSDIDKKTLESCVDDFFKLLYGANIKGKKAYIDSSKDVASSPAPAKAVAPPPVQSESSFAANDQTVTANRRVSTKYGITVTNELFHNGNVEAWKKIIESYKVAHAGCDVLIWYDGERINDINALFKWGKVKRGNPIMFSVAGADIKNVAKLKKYLFEGASSRFEVFLNGPVGAVLDLF